jgi:4,5:9,10-diseco-3-hydroxy-5,9,17-trioxoandrosta-1(10),2-diene-4-oate hydrolase
MNPSPPADLLRRIDLLTQRKAVAAHGFRTWYLEAGAGRPVILLHGLAARGLMWFPVIGSLARHCRVIAPDLIGHGASDNAPGTCDRALYSAWLLDLFDSIEVSRASIVGHSLGGAIALQFTLDHPDRVERLALVSSAGLGNPKLSTGLLLLAGILLPMGGLRRRLYQWLTLWGSEQGIEMFKAYEEATREDPRGLADFMRLVRMSRKVVQPFSAEDLAQIRPPTLLVWGEGDRNFPVAHAEAAHRVMPSSRLRVVDQCRHIPLFDQRDLFNQLLCEFLSLTHNGAASHL